MLPKSNNGKTGKSKKGRGILHRTYRQQEEEEKKGPLCPRIDRQQVTVEEATSNGRVATSNCRHFDQ